jgi:hypothetical protein
MCPSLLSSYASHGPHRGASLPAPYEQKARNLSLLTSHTRSGLAIVRGGIHPVMDTELPKRIWSSTRERVRWSARPGVISGVISFLFFVGFMVETTEAQGTPPAQATPSPSTTPSPSSPPAQVGTVHPEKAQLPATAQNIKLQTSPKVTEVLNSAPLIIKDDDTQIIRLKKMRFNMALTEAKDRYILFKKGIIKLYDLIDVGQRLLSAQADLAQSPEERADVLQKQLEIYAEAEDNLQKQIKEGKAENADLDHLRYERLGVEIDLEVLRRGMAE